MFKNRFKNFCFFVHITYAIYALHALQSMHCTCIMLMQSVMPMHEVHWICVLIISCREYICILICSFLSENVLSMINKNDWRLSNLCGSVRNELVCMLAHREIFSKSYQIKLKSDCIYHFSIYFNPSGRPFGF